MTHYEVRFDVDGGPIGKCHGHERNAIAAAMRMSDRRGHPYMVFRVTDDGEFFVAEC